MAKIIVAIVIIAAVMSGVAYKVVQPTPLPLPTFQRDPSGISQSTVSDVRIRNSKWLSKDGGRVWAVCRFGDSNRVTSHFLVNLQEQSTEGVLHGANLVGWINEREILVYNQGNPDSKWESFMRVLNPESPAPKVTQFFMIDSESGTSQKVCEVSTRLHLNFLEVSPNGKRAVASWGPQEMYEFDLTPGAVPREVTEEYVWSPVWLDDTKFVFLGQEHLRLREFGAETSKSISRPLLKEVRDAISEFGSPTLKIIGKVGEDILMVDHDPGLGYDQLLVLDQKNTLVKPVAKMISSADLPRFNRSGTMMVYQGQQYDENMDTVFLQTVEIDSQPIELVAGEFGTIQESTPLFLNEESVLYIHRGIEIRSISLADGEIHLHWPIAVIP